MVFQLRYMATSAVWPGHLQIFASVPHKMFFSSDTPDCNLALLKSIEILLLTPVINRTTTVSIPGNQWKFSLFTAKSFDSPCRSLKLTASFYKIFAVRTPGHLLIISKRCRVRCFVGQCFGKKWHGQFISRVCVLVFHIDLEQ